MKTEKYNLIKSSICFEKDDCCCGCSSNIADYIVYGKIRTSNKNHDYVEAFAVKGDKFIYVGDKEGSKKFIKDGTTKIIDKSDGFVMPGATEGHGHYIMSAVMQTKGFISYTKTLEETFEYLKNTIKNNPNSNLYLTYGWDNVKLGKVKGITDVRKILDEICSNKPVIMIDDTGHNIFMNSLTIEKAGLTKDTFIEGGFISKNDEGRLLGLASDIAMNYVLNKVLKPSNFLSPKDFEEALQGCEQLLHSLGYTSYFDAYTSYFGESAFKGISEYDKKHGLKVYIEGSYKIDPFEDIDKGLEETKLFKEKYTTKRFKPDIVKLFADGECVESMSGWVIKPYKDGTYGTQVWQDEAMFNTVKKANAMGLSVHVHTSGDGATSQAVNAFVAAEKTAKDGVINSLAHSRHITEETKKLMAEHKIPSATNICWRIYPKIEEDHMHKAFDYDWYIHGYPMKSLLNKGVIMSSSTDFPSNAGGPCDIPNIMELAVNGTVDPESYPLDELGHLSEDEQITLEEALDVFTINGAKQLGIENERGSIEVGKFADFLYLDKDLTKLALNEIHKAKVAEVYFEGKLVYKL